MSIGLGRMEMGRVFFVQSFVESVLKIRKRSIVDIRVKMVARVHWLSVAGFYSAKTLEGHRHTKYASFKALHNVTSCDIFIGFKDRSIVA